MDHENVVHGYAIRKNKAIWLIYIFLVFILILLVPFFFGKNYPDVKFNQHYIESLDHEFDATTSKEKWNYFLSYYSYKVNNIFHGPSKQINYDDPDEVFTFLFEKLPYFAIVHPTEMYYYYTFDIEDQTVSGNFRLVELDRGQLSLGYFDFYNKTTPPHHKMFSIGDGLIIEKVSEINYKISYNGKTVRFKLSDLPLKKPNIKTIPEEEFITRVRDESGIIFYLFFNSKHKAFYYVLDQERPITENLIDNGYNIFVGDRTDFAYYYDGEYDRYVHFGVLAKNIYLNNYFDGPFDQVYPFLDIRDEIYKVYPYTQFGGGVDEYGNFVDRESTRVAISPYVDYFDFEDLNERLSDCQKTTESKSELWSCLSYEDKRDFHNDSKAFNKDGTLKKLDD